MITSRRSFLIGATAATGFNVGTLSRAVAAEPVVTISSPMDAPEWALLERQLLTAHTAACTAFFMRYFNQDTGYLEATVRWGGDDGADDAIENVNDWPHVYALGGDEILRAMYTKAYEGHVRQYTEAKTTDVPFAKLGMYFKEFPVCFDWEHNGEGLTVFNLMPLGDPYSRSYIDRVKRFSSFYMNEDPGAPNYDPKHRIIKSLFNGSRGPLMRKATPLDWAGDPIDVKNRIAAYSHSDYDYKMMLAHFDDYTDIVGDHPLNLNVTSPVTNAYLLTHDPKYKKWVLDYVDAWVDRAKRNNDIIPSNIGLDGKIGGEGTNGKWYGGVYGWSFSPIVPQTGKPADRNLVPRGVVGFMNAYLLSGGEDKYLDVWRKQADKIDEQKKTIGGVVSTPRMYGDNGWYSFTPGNYNLNFLEIYYLSMKPADRARAERTDWYDYLEGKKPDYPVKALQAGLARVRKCMQIVRADNTSPDERLSDSVMDYNPATVLPLTQLMEGGLFIEHITGWAKTSPQQGGTLLFCRLRYFDPNAQRAGIPKDMAALVDSMNNDGVTVTLVNLNLTEPRLVIIQAGAYGEHQVLSVSDGHTTHDINAAFVKVRVAPGAGAKLTIRMTRFANQPTLNFPWDSAVSGNDVGVTDGVMPRDSMKTRSPT